MAKARCSATTKAGKRCRNAPVHGDVCTSHAPRKVKEAVGFGGPQPGAGRPRLPRPHEVLRERIEADIEAWIAPYARAREAERPVVVGRGDEAYVEMVPDYKLQLEAADAALNRVYGRPKQLLEHTGKDEGPVQHAVDIGDPKVRGHLDKALEASAKAERAPR